MDTEVAEQEPQLLSKRKQWLRLGGKAIRITVWVIVVFYLVPFAAYSFSLINEVRFHNNFKPWGRITLKKYAYEETSDEMFPPLTRYDGLWVPDLKLLYPEHIRDLDQCVDPYNRGSLGQMAKIKNQDPIDFEKATRLMAQSYVYPGWLVQSAADVETIKRVREEEQRRSGDIQTEDGCLYWLRGREEVEQLFITDSNDYDANAKMLYNMHLMIARPRPESLNYTSTFTWWRHFFDRYLFRKPPRIVVPTIFLDGHYEYIPLDTAPEHIKALVELFPDRAEE